ncbi:MAG TPA: nucleotide sugar dehydrogenase [Vicinamibacterales bacterium]
MRVSVFGLGYVGCVTAAGLARGGHDVWGIDVDAGKAALIAAGQSPIVEPGLPELIAEMVAAGRLHGTASIDEALAGSDLALVCVGTPSARNGQLDTTAVRRVCEQIGAAIAADPRPFTVVVRSTVLPGTIDTVVRPALRRAAGEAASMIRVASNPEFMREGSSLADFVNPPFTLVGADEPEAVEQLRQLYDGVVNAPFIHAAIRPAEMMKYVSNAFHAVKVAFANEIGEICDALDVDAEEVTRLFLADTKLNASGAYLKPGFAFGGSCLPKDVRALAYAARASDVAAPLLTSVMPSNELQVRRAIDAILATGRRRIGLVGLAFKPGSDDLRESPFVAVAEALIGKGCSVRVLDPNLSLARLRGSNRRFIEQEIPHLASVLCDDVRALAAHAEVLVIGHPGREATEALALIGPDTVVIDLTRRTAGRRADRRPALVGPS